MVGGAVVAVLGGTIEAVVGVAAVVAASSGDEVVVCSVPRTSTAGSVVGAEERRGSIEASILKLNDPATGGALVFGRVAGLAESESTAALIDCWPPALDATVAGSVRDHADAVRTTTNVSAVAATRRCPRCLSTASQTSDAPTSMGGQIILSDRGPTLDPINER